MVNDEQQEVFHQSAKQNILMVTKDPLGTANLAVIIHQNYCEYTDIYGILSRVMVHQRSERKRRKEPKIYNEYIIIWHYF